MRWYTAPWRTTGRKEFGIGLTLVTLPGLFLMVFGWGNTMGSYLAPVMGVLADGISPEALMQGMAALQSDAAPAGFTIDWTGVVNGLLLLALIPLVRMRLRDMGWFGWREVVLTAVLNVSVAAGVVYSLTGYDLLPLGFMWGVINFAGYAWLMLAKGKPRGRVQERTNYDKPVIHDQRTYDDD